MSIAVKPKAVRLERWGVVLNGNVYQAPECQARALQGVVYGHPKKPDGTSVQTSAIVGVDGRLVTTSSGTTYELVGEPDDDYAAYLRGAGLRFDPENPTVNVELQ